MKNVFFTVALLMIATLFANAQVKTPAPSPSAKMMQTVGMTEVIIDYSRPGMKGREIFGGLVPYKEIWRTGANAATKITFSSDVIIEKNELKAGTYALYTIPSETEWTIIFHKNLTSNTGNYNVEEDVLRFNVKSSQMDNAVETFTIGVSNIGLGTANIDISWENTMVSLAIDTKVDAQVQSTIEKALSGPSMDDYYQAAAYNLVADKDLKQALEWINIAMEKGATEKFWMVRRKALIEAKLGQYKKAIASAKMSLELAEKANNTDYVRMNEESIKEWEKM
jgi:tetratricopeptide (TPR) repeat protein